MGIIASFTVLYLAPLLFALGIVALIHGAINYFIIGPGFDVGRKEQGKQGIARALVLFLAAILAVSAMQWFISLSSSIRERLEGDVEYGTDVLPVPDVPEVR